MKKLILLSVISASCLLTACTNTQVETKRVINTRTLTLNNGKSINISTVHSINGEVIYDTDTRLNVVTKTDRAKAVGAKVLQFGLSVFTGQATTGFTKEQLKGNYIESVENKTVEYVNPNIDLLLKSLNINSTEPNDVSIEPYKFKLIYSDTDNYYDFIYRFNITVNGYSQWCSSEDLVSNDRLKPFEEWEKNNYELTQIISKKVVDTCFEKMNVSSEKEKLETEINKIK